MIIIDVVITEKEVKKMNVFMPCESIIESVQSLDDARLIKQIFECKVLLDGARAYQSGEKPNGYFKHPVAQHYKEYPLFLSAYGTEACLEYTMRFGKTHRLYDYFCSQNYLKIIDVTYQENHPAILYAEGRKNTPECIRTTAPEKVYELFKQKLINKWKADEEKGRPPKWTNRGMPEWAKEVISN